MANIRSINIEAFRRDIVGHRGNELPSPADYVRIVKSDGGSFLECNPTSGKLYFVMDIMLKKENPTSHFFDSYEWEKNVVMTKWGPAVGGYGNVVAAGSMQLYLRDEIIKKLLNAGRIIECGKYNPQRWELYESFIREYIKPVMDADYAEYLEATGHGTPRQPWEPKPHPRNTVPLSRLREYNSVYIGSVIYRVLPGQKITCRWSGLALENDEITGVCLSQLDPDGAAQTAVGSKLIERVGVFGRSEKPWENGLRPIYDKKKEPKYPAWGEEEF